MKESNLTNCIFYVVVSAILAASFSLPASAEQEAPSADLSVAFLSAHVWRSRELSRDILVIQPSMTIGYKGFAANIWGNVDTDPYSATNADTKGNVRFMCWRRTDPLQSERGHPCTMFKLIP